MRNFNSSISWTEQANVGNSILFNGSAVWVYGLVGGEAGSYEVILDNVTQGIYNAAGGPRVSVQHTNIAQWSGLMTTVTTRYCGTPPA